MSRPNPARQALEVLDQVIYVLVGVVLVVAAGATLVAGTYQLADGLADEDGTKHAVESALDALLLTFILVELLGAVRTTLSERALVAEPFLLVGMIASIKEIVVLTAFERDDVEAGELAIQVGALAGVVLALAVAALLVRRKEREPGETGATGGTSDVGAEPLSR